MMVGTGARLPTDICTVADWLPPRPSFTVRRAVNRPGDRYVCSGLARLETGEPSPKSQVYWSTSPSGSPEPALEKPTSSGGYPSSGVAEATAVGGVLPAV